jgi:DNA polymerase I-like protein with 3'-5' exonuclease and polymerase domains
VLVLFNAKRDLHWLRRYKIQFGSKRIWDVQSAFFIHQAQAVPYPSLNDVANYYELPVKNDEIQEEYWSKGIDTNDVPLDKLIPYLVYDCVLTRDCFLKQLETISEKQQKLIWLVCQDLLILEEMEWNGIIYDVEESNRLAEEVRTEISKIDETLVKLVGDYPINWNSNDHLSAVLYGGVISSTIRVPDGMYKTGKKAGQTKYKLEERIYTFKRLVEPIKGSELAKEGYYSTSEPILRQIRANGRGADIINNLLTRAKLDKLVSSYYEGLPNQILTRGWQNNIIHGTLNQCVAITGRLSSSKPNLQNTDKRVEKLFRSRYD